MVLMALGEDKCYPEVRREDEQVEAGSLLPGVGLLQWVENCSVYQIGET